MKKVYSIYDNVIYEQVNRSWNEEKFGRVQHMLTELAIKPLHNYYKLTSLRRRNLAFFDQLPGVTLRLYDSF